MHTSMQNEHGALFVYGYDVFTRAINGGNGVYFFNPFLANSILTVPKYRTGLK